MKTTLALSAAALLVLAAPAMAKGHSNKAEARAMADALKSGINQDQETKDAVDSLEIGTAKPNANAAVPARVSGGKNGGWGNIGSTLTGPEGEDLSTSVSGR